MFSSSSFRDSRSRDSRSKIALRASTCSGGSSGGVSVGSGDRNREGRGHGRVGGGVTTGAVACVGAGSGVMVDGEKKMRRVATQRMGAVHLVDRLPPYLLLHIDTLTKVPLLITKKVTVQELQTDVARRKAIRCNLRWK